MFLAFVSVRSAVPAYTDGPTCDPFAAGRELRLSCSDNGGCKSECLAVSSLQTLLALSLVLADVRNSTRSLHLESMTS